MFSFSSDLLCGNGKPIEYEQKDGYEQITFIAESKPRAAALMVLFPRKRASGGKTRLWKRPPVLRDALTLPA